MFLIILELLFIILLITVLFMIYRGERASSKNALPQGQALEYWDGRERRKYFRFDKSLDVSVDVRKRSHYTDSGKTGNISEGGVKILTDQKLANGTIIGLNIPIPGSGMSAEVEGEVMWTEEVARKDPSAKRLFYSGIMFRASPDPSYNILINYVRSLQPGKAGN